MQKERRENQLAFIVFLQAITYGLAIAYGNTTLVPRIVPSIIVGIHYILAFYIAVGLASRRGYKNTGKMFKLILVCVLFFVSYFNVYEGISKSFINYIGVIPLLVFCFVDDTLLLKSTRYFERFMVLSSIIGIFVYILYVIGLRFRTVPFYSDSGGEYTDYFVSYILTSHRGVALCGLFNEPGFFGTIAAFFIIINKCNFRLRKNRLLLYAGLLTWSMAFYVLVFGGFVIFSLKTTKSRIIALFFSLFFFWVIQSVHTGNAFIDGFIERFQFDSELGQFKGDNRASSLELKADLAEFLIGDRTAWGYGTGFTGEKDYGGVSTPLTYFLEWGIWGCSLTFGLLIFFALKVSWKCKHALVFVSLFIISIYQRPNIFSMEYLLLLFGGILMCYEYESRLTDNIRIKQKTFG